MHITIGNTRGVSEVDRRPVLRPCAPYDSGFPLLVLAAGLGLGTCSNAIPRFTRVRRNEKHSPRSRPFRVVVLGWARLIPGDVTAVSVLGFLRGVVRPSYRHAGWWLQRGAVAA